MKTLAPLVSLFALVAALTSAPRAHALYSELFVFGDSLSDSGNNALVLAPNVTPVPISGNSFIPDFPYASGAYTNSLVWAQSFATSLGLSANPALVGGTNYAFGGARTGPLSGSLFSPFPPTLQTQAAFFLSQHGSVAPNDALYVVAGGGDNARDALDAIFLCAGDLVCIGAAINAAANAYATDIATIVAQLGLAGADDIIVWNVPDLGAAPAVAAAGASAIATLVASSMNAALLLAIGGVPDVKVFDFFDLVQDVVTTPGAFGLANVTDACAQFANCDPSTYLFWDGIHPTSAGHLIIGNAMLALVPEPATLTLLGLGLVALGFAHRRKN